MLITSSLTSHKLNIFINTSSIEPFVNNTLPVYNSYNTVHKLQISIGYEYEQPMIISKARYGRELRKKKTKKKKTYNKSQYIINQIIIKNIKNIFLHYQI
jgi:hypothetical protein